MSSKLYIIDGSGYIYRAYYAIKQQLTNSEGLPTGALFGFTKMLLKLLNDKGVENVAIAFDTKVPTFRHEKYPEYKANRKATPDDLVKQMPYFREIVEGLGIKALVQDGFEADDIIGTIAKNFSAQGMRVVIVSGDKDLSQLVSDKISVWDAMKNVHYDKIKVREKFGINPEQIVDLLALSGDTSDNIPGARGIGEKTAVQLLNEFDSLDSLLANLDKLDVNKTIRGAKSVKEKIQNSLDNIELSKFLATINCDVPVFNTENDISKFTWAEYNLDVLLPIFEKLEFQNLLKEIIKKDNGKLREQIADSKIPTDAEYTVLSPDDLPAFAEKLAQQNSFAFDVETTSLNPLECELIGVAISFEDKKGFFIPLYSHLEPQKVIPLELFKEHFGYIFASTTIKKIGWNLKFDISVLEEKGIKVNAPFIDGMLVQALLHPDDRESKGLKQQALIVLKEQMATFEEVVGDNSSIADIEIERTAAYACHDADATWRLTKILYKQLKDISSENNTTQGQSPLNEFNNIEMPLIRVLSLIECTGIKVHIPSLEKLKKEFASEISNLTAEIYKLVGHEFNINSPKQLSEILFGELNLPYPLRIKSNEKQLSTSVKVLEELNAQGHKIAEFLIEYREIQKLQSTYVEPLLKQADSARRIHSSFNQAQVATGRLSSSDPNLQNIPIRNERGAQLRKVFVGDAGYKLIKADYSQIELRVLAHLSDDKNLIQAFLSGEDFHLRTAKDIFGEEASDPTRKKELRRYAKSINFGIVYGMGANSLAKMLSIPRAQAQEYIEGYFRKYPQVQEYFTKIDSQIAQNGCVETLFGRRRYVSELQANTSIGDPNFIKRSLLNGIIQGTAAEIVKLAMIGIMDKLPKYNFDLLGKPTKENRGLARMVLQVHDELVFEVHESVLSEVKQLIIQQMENAVQLNVPLKVDVEIGASWGA